MGDDVYFYGLYSGDSFTGEYLFPDSWCCIREMCIQPFKCQLHINKTVANKIQYLFISSQLCRSKDRDTQLNFLLKVSQGQNQDVSKAKLLSRGFGKESAFKLIQAISGIHFLVVIGLGLYFYTSLSVGHTGSSQRLLGYFARCSAPFSKQQ